MVRPHYGAQPAVSPQVSDRGGSAWRDLAACLDVPTWVFYEGPEEEAVAVCRRCPVTVECLADADARESRSSTFGVRGGLTEAGRLARRKAATR